ncbi:MAG: 50S ribosomal protein L18 [Thermoplasmata archaeon]|nr:50S ribosomal protein L18 [Candidatus Sysuiplasma acidicola]MBX8637769.1 50S ribosomal protein L18 [Candidatus Sysuiplasma acidicola]MBX8646633.1 50S ribosomal protein L18 [Candidatus Sysuiplasma acidicola]MDH2905932.1 50S ribosomal protein L18 [Methanomassiliicoccales archaeon]
MFGPRYKVPFRRRREGNTDYSHRLKLLKSDKPRAVVRKSNKYYTVQFVRFDPVGDAVIASAGSIELRRYGWTGAASNSAAAYLTGMLAASRAKKQGITEAILDAGIVNPKRNSGIFAALNGIVEAGLDVPHDPAILLPKERIEKLAATHGKLDEIKTKLVN